MKAAHSSLYFAVDIAADSGSDTHTDYAATATAADNSSDSYCTAFRLADMEFGHSAEIKNFEAGLSSCYAEAAHSMLGHVRRCCWACSRDKLSSACRNVRRTKFLA